MKRKETKKIFNINRNTLNIIGIALLTIIIIVISIIYSVQMKREYINGDKNLPFKLDKTTIITVLDGQRKNIENDNENENLEVCDIDKMWDALHFLLTGKSAGEPIKDNLISEAIVGQFNISGEEIEEFISGTKTDRVKEIAKALQELDFETYIDKFDMNAFHQNDIYPNIWEYEDEADEIKDDLRTSFESLKKFYEKMAAQESAALVSIY